MLTLLAGTAFAADDTTWRLEDIYPTTDAYDQARTKVQSGIAQLGDCKGKLGQDAATMLACLDKQYAVALELSHLSSYATNHVSADTRDDAWQVRQGQVQQLQTSFAAATAWVDPEVVQIGQDKIDQFLKAEPKLATYAYPLHAILRHGAHVLSPGEERILALSTPLQTAPSDTYVTFTNANLPWPEFTLPDGSKTKLTQAEYTRLRTNPDAGVRKAVFDTFFGALGSYQDTLGALLGTQVQAHWFEAQARGYKSSLEASLDAYFIPREVYDTLIKQTNENLPTLHRYLKLRAEMLGIDHLQYSDLYVPLVASDRKFTFEQSKQLALASAAPLGADYVAAMKEGFAGGWIDAYPREGKVPGAYMSDEAYGIHPFVLLNHVDDYESASTLAHEYGHAMHSHLAESHQPFPTASYPTFLAEIASTFNEALLLDYELKNAKTDDDKLFFLGSALEQLRTTFYRQAMFAEYELAIHEQVEKGEPLTGGELTRMYAELVRRYYGQDQGICNVDDKWTSEWAYVPHFYYDFYVYQYATSLAASSELSQEVLAKKKGAVEAYLAMLSAGGSDDPYVLLKKTGVDLATPEPYKAVVARMNAIMDQIDAIRAKKKKK